MNLEDRHMKKRAFIIHGWGGNPEEGWFPWLKQQLEEKGFEVIVPKLPDADKPRIEKWIPALAKAVGAVDENTFFVGHSSGCQAILRFLETLAERTKIGGAVFVAGYISSLTGLESESEWPNIKKYWLGTPIDFKKINSHLPKSIAILSDNDPYVPLGNQDDFRERLSSEIIVEHNMGHFGESNGVFKLPIVLELILKISKVEGD